jgi:hypothetical protein
MTMEAPFVHVFMAKDGPIQRPASHHDTALWFQALDT